MCEEKEIWISDIIDTLEKTLEDLEAKTKAVKNAIHVFKTGQGWLTDDMPKKIFFWGDLNGNNDGNASE